jgi:NADH-quinone oxidoreductase subunit J
VTEVLFVILSFLMLLGGAGVLFFRQPLHAGMSFIVTIIALAGLFALLSHTFLFMVQIILYAGAVITLMLFVIMVLNVQESVLPDESLQPKTLFIGVLCLAPIVIAVVKALGSLPFKELYIVPSDFGGIELLGAELFTSWVLPFELISVLLLVALVAAVILANKKEKA